MRGRGCARNQLKAQANGFALADDRQHTHGECCRESPANHLPQTVKTASRSPRMGHFRVGHWVEIRVRAFNQTAESLKTLAESGNLCLYRGGDGEQRSPFCPSVVSAMGARAFFLHARKPNVATH